MFTRFFDWLFDKFQASGAEGALADRARRRLADLRDDGAAPDGPKKEALADAVPALNRRERRLQAAKRRKRRKRVR